MLVCYLDDSSAEMSKVETIAGYVASEEGWARFEAEADTICGRYGVDVLRGSDIENRKGCYRGWPILRINRLLSEIGTALYGNVLFGISRSVDKLYFRLRKRQLQIHPNLSGFGYCFGTIVCALREEEGLGTKHQFRADGVAFRLEAGSRNNPDCFRYFSDEQRHGNINSFCSVAEVGKRSCRAVQVADLYAFYSRRRANKFARLGENAAVIADLFYIHVQSKIPHYTGYISEPYREGRNVRTGEVFQVLGLATPV